MKKRKSNLKKEGLYSKHKTNIIAFGFMGAVMLSLFLYAQFFDSSIYNNPEPKTPVQEVNLVNIANLVNEERAKHGLPILKEQVDLEVSAREKCNDMQDKKYFEHTAPDGATGFDFIKKHFPHYELAGENLEFEDGLTDKEIVDNWIKSPTHEKNIIEPGFEYVGYGICGYSDKENGEGFVIVQHFADPYPYECNPGYEPCLQNVPYDANCGNFQLKNFKVIGVDNWDLDGDGDGVACEPYE